MSNILETITVLKYWFHFMLFVSTAYFVILFELKDIFFCYNFGLFLLYIGKKIVMYYPDKKKFFHADHLL